jgi:hypothetical protein
MTKLRLTLGSYRIVAFVEPLEGHLEGFRSRR